MGAAYGRSGVGRVLGVGVREDVPESGRVLDASVGGHGAACSRVGLVDAGRGRVLRPSRYRWLWSRIPGAPAFHHAGHASLSGVGVFSPRREDYRGMREPTVHGLDWVIFLLLELLGKSAGDRGEGFRAGDWDVRRVDGHGQEDCQGSALRCAHGRTSQLGF